MSFSSKRWEDDYLILRFSSMYEWNFWSFLCICSMCYWQQISINYIAEHLSHVQHKHLQGLLLLSPLRHMISRNDIILLWQFWRHLKIVTAVPDVDSSSEQKINHLSTIKNAIKECVSLALSICGSEFRWHHVDHNSMYTDPIFCATPPMCSVKVQAHYNIFTVTWWLHVKCMCV